MNGDLKFYKYVSSAMYNVNNYTEIDGESIGVHLGKDMVGALLQPAAMKSDITNVSRTEHGTRVKQIPYLAERSVTLNLVITGNSRASHNANLEALLDILYSGHFAIKIPSVGNYVWFLNYQNSQSYSLTRSGRSSKLAIKCVEYRPDIRSWQ